MNDAQLARLLAAQNPWWRHVARWRADDPDLGRAADAGFVYRPDPLAGIAPPGLYVLRGPRRVGKSLELKRAVERLLDSGVHPRQVIFCACDTLRAQDLRRLFQVGRNLTRSIEGPRYWLLDEVTAIPDGWSAVVKQARDQGPIDADCVVLTGSSARDLREARKDLAGRRGGVATSERLLLPMGFRSFCSALASDSPAGPTLRAGDFLHRDARDAILELAFWQEELEQLWELYLEVGGFPRAVDGCKRTSDVTETFVHELWDVVSGEALRRSAMSDVEIRALLDRLSVNLASPLNLTTVAKDVRLGTHHTVSSRIHDLTVAFLTWVCYQSRDEAPNLAAQRKVYFADPLLAGLAHRLDPALPAPDHSVLSEQQLGCALLRSLADDQASALIEGGQVMYERTPTGAEIDFVGPALGIPFESKYVDTGWRREARTLTSRHGRGVIATRGALDVDSEIWAVPVSMVAWLLSPPPTPA